MTSVNSVCFDSLNYKDEYDMWYSINDLVRVLIKNRYIVMIEDVECGMIEVTFENDDKSLGGPYPLWLTPEEIDSLSAYHYDAEPKEATSGTKEKDIPFA